ncbi:hypothetical protein I7X12_05640 [Halosimplex litoreum]|uniref:Uncharacterized protein n=1 Tax=Halosimplex litoreum TaxID=1198301 RepID=A0A7T3KWI9_9EURY|nr:hypothetical protein [Halosimplex litoreum]QPV64108.1 hypothetical protein I7X12_05640 [Halosimplex litoreum]
MRDGDTDGDGDARHGQFRVFGFDGERTALLRDVDAGVPRWTCPGDDEQVPLTGSLSPGAVVEATLEPAADGGEPWALRSVSTVRETTLAFVTHGAPPGPVVDTWLARDSNTGVGVSLRRDSSGDPVCELQTIPQWVEGLDRWEALRAGAQSLERWYDGTDTVAVAPVHLVFVNVMERPFVALYAVPSEGHALARLRDALGTGVSERGA